MITRHRIQGTGKIEVIEVQTIIVWNCEGCGVLYGATQDFLQLRRTDGKGFYCPNGCRRFYTETAAKKLAQAEERLAAEKGWSSRLSESLAAEEKRHAVTKGQLTKTRNHIQAGVCPDCHRQFVNVERHMASKHPRVALAVVR